TMSNNPLLYPWDTPFGLPPFTQVRAKHFKPAFAQALAEHRAELDAIGAQTAPPTFDNTLAAFDRSGRLLARIDALFHNLCASETSPALQAVQREMAAPLAAHANAVYMHAALFKRIDALHGERQALVSDGPQALRAAPEGDRPPCGGPVAGSHRSSCECSSACIWTSCVR